MSENKLYRFRAVQFYLLCSLYFLFTTSFRWSQNDTQELDYSLHAKYMYHFTKYFEWPSEKTAGSFIIGVYNNHDLYTELKKIGEVKKINNRNLIVIELATDDDPSNCQMLFIGRPSLATVDKIMLKLGGKPVMVLGDKMGYLKRGIDINFIIRDELLRFELNNTSLQSKNIKVAKEMIALASLVK